MKTLGIFALVVISMVMADKVSDQLARQLMMQQLQIEEKTRTDGDSGIKMIRLREQGSKSYHSTSHTRGSVFSIHDHTNHRLTVGMGELEVILNGVQFRTRHNDYSLKQKSSTSPNYNAVEEIEFPDIPKAVTRLKSAEDQIVEMALWVKAWAHQDYSVRDYRPHFRANLCYLEGAWTNSRGTIEESFDSDRHFLDAKTWFQMQENIRFTAYTGSKDSLENFSYLPTKIFDLVNGSIPVFAQWNYRILCHPIKRDIPFNRMRVFEDLTSMMSRHKDRQQLKASRAARFTLNTHDSSRFQDGIKNYGLLDELMYEIPGKDNYKANLTDSYGVNTYLYNDVRTPLNPGFYHRWYSTRGKDAGGRSTRHRAFNDANLFFAMTTQDKVAGMKYKNCRGRGRQRKCQDISQKWSYAIPLEIVYSTPLQIWNPYNIKYKEGEDSKSVDAGSRDGSGNSAGKALNGTNHKFYYRTPASLFSNTNPYDADAADTVRGSLNVLDSAGKVRRTMASGTRIFISGIRGTPQPIRQRYPIAPLYVEGNTMWKELEALQDIVLNLQKYSFALNEKLEATTGSTLKPGVTKPTTVSPVIGITVKTGPGVKGHVHMVTLGPVEVAMLKKGKRVKVITEESLSHTHVLIVRYVKRTRKFLIMRCDNRGRCKDGHDRYLHHTVTAVKFMLASKRFK